MQNVLAAMAMIILAGAAWRSISGDARARAVRIGLATAVYEIFLPALVLDVMWHVRVDMNLLRIPAVAGSSILLSLLAAWWFYGDGERIGGRGSAGAMLLASGFGNFTYLGLPVLTQIFGPWAQSVAIPFDVFASTPLLFTLGVLLARRYGDGDPSSPWEVVKVPAVWAAVAGLGLNAFAPPPPAWLRQGLHIAGTAVVPMMLLSVGLALRRPRGWMRYLPALVPMLFIQLGLMPLIAWGTSIAVGIPDRLLAPCVVEAGMPCMILGLVFCDRYHLNGELYAQAVTVSTALSLVSLPLWFKLTA